MTTYVIDTNVLARFLLKDDLKQYLVAESYFKMNDCYFYIPIHVFCEMVWLMNNKLKIPKKIIVDILYNLSSQKNILHDKESFECGMEFLKNNGDFADGVIAHHSSDFVDGVLGSADTSSRQTIKFEICGKRTAFVPAFVLKMAKSCLSSSKT
ncbi:MAG: hypothetical protein Q4G13_07700 [Moraxella sp.]|nr:hypothetical protein [Moraxella sp.]